MKSIVFRHKPVRGGHHSDAEVEPGAAGSGLSGVRRIVFGHVRSHLQGDPLPIPRVPEELLTVSTRKLTTLLPELGTPWALLS